MDDVLTVSVDTKISAIRQHLQGKHGLFHHLMICKDVFSEETELRQDALRKSLREYGFVGDACKENAPCVTVYYNFIPSGLSCPQSRLDDRDRVSLQQWSGILHDPVLLS